MAPGHWLVKSEPSTYSWERFVAEGGARWDGVRNAQARNNLAAMRAGDRVLFYHSGSGKSIVGLARVTRAAYPDPTAKDGDWLAVDLAPLKALARPVALTEIRADKALAAIALIRQSRLSVMPLAAREFERILALGGTQPR